jgi:phosphoglycerate dehydrogenase-like enzyme
VINVGRGGTIDQDALFAALAEHRIGGAALDVFATEPLPDDSPLWELDNVLLSPHTAALSLHENERIVDLFIDNLGRFRRGEPLRNVVDPQRFY